MEHVHVSIENVMGAFSHDIYSVCSEITDHTGACMRTQLGKALRSSHSNVNFHWFLAW